MNDLTMYEPGDLAATTGRDGRVLFWQVDDAGLFKITKGKTDYVDDEDDYNDAGPYALDHD